MPPEDAFLWLAESHVLEGEMRVSEQRMRVARFAARGWDVALGQELLVTMEETLDAMYADLALARHARSHLCLTS